MTDTTREGRYTPAHPVSVTAIVTLSNGKTVEVTVDERSHESKGDLYGAVFPAGVLTGHLARTVQAELRAARESAEAYARGETWTKVDL